MITVSVEDIQTQIACFTNICKSGASAPLLYDSFIAKTHPVIANLLNKQYPYDVKVPKSLQALAEHDFEPAYIIHLEKPPIRKVPVVIKCPDGTTKEELMEVPIWYGDTSDVIYLRFGYKNGDSRFYSQECLGDSDVHGFVGGATGQGKSVALNNLIFNAVEEYPPWELQLILSDSKIVEFKAYAKNPLPHIDSIAATSDADYQISVLGKLCEEMMKRNSIFSSIGAKKLKEFRKETGLCMPRVLIVMDEVQTAFKFAGKKSAKLLEYIDSFVRLGRSTGYHLLMASQEIGHDIPADTLGNIKLRAALGCTEKTSEVLIGNGAAKEFYGRPGNVIVNDMQGDVKANTLYRIPFLSSKRQSAIENDLVDLGHKYKFKSELSFYDEEKHVYESDYDDYLRQFPFDANKLYLGEPSYYMPGDYKVTSLDLTGRDTENILVYNRTAKSQLRFFTMLKKNIMLHKTRDDKINNVVLCANDLFSESGKAEELVSAKSCFCKEKSYVNSQFFGIVKSVIDRRKLMLKIDELVFSSSKTGENEDAMFYKIFKKGSSYDTVINRSRAFYMYDALQFNQEFQHLMTGNTPEQKEEKFLKLLKIIMSMYEMYGCKSTKVEKQNFPKVYNWVLGLDKIIGLGRSVKSKQIEEFKTMLQTSVDVNVRFIIFAMDLSEAYDIRDAIHWVLIDESDNSLLQNVKCECFPMSKSNGLAVVFNKMDAGGSCYKFKKMLFNKEIV